MKEPNRTDRDFENTRREYSIAANWFVSGHNNKLTMDFSYLTLDDDLLGRGARDTRARVQWDVSF